VKNCGLIKGKDFVRILNMPIKFQPKKRKRKRTHGFLIRKRRGGKILKRRRKKGRWKLAV
jgi:large subunit ribosomal protein L34